MNKDSTDMGMSSLGRKANRHFYLKFTGEALLRPLYQLHKKSAKNIDVQSALCYPSEMKFSSHMVRVPERYKTVGNTPEIALNFLPWEETQHG
jgi:hypothetical protein